MLSKSATFAALPPLWPQDPLPAIRAAISTGAPKLVVLDDDPTGTQTVHDVPVVTDWSIATLAAELTHADGGFYILTNSRSLTAEATRTLHRELAENLRTAAQLTHTRFSLVSRSDSTLRGHFPLETDTLASILGRPHVTLVAPYFEAGGRYTIDGIHYVAEGDGLMPAAETPFARDATFGYRHSDLRAWVEEKSGGKIPAARVGHIPLRALRSGGPEAVAKLLRGFSPGSVVVADCAAPRDAEVLALATLLIEQSGLSVLGRIAASFVAARLGQEPRPLLEAADFSGNGGISADDTASEPAPDGGLVVVGSYVPKTTAQVQALRAAHPDAASRVEVELSVPALLDPARRAAAISDAIAAVNSALTTAPLTLLYTSRELITGRDADESLAIVNSVSAALIEVVRGIRQRPRFLIAKGGITSSDVATRGLGVRRALVRGQILPGVPVWRLGDETRFPGLDYVVFPGNVGGNSALADAVAKLSSPLTP